MTIQVPGKTNVNCQKIYDGNSSTINTVLPTPQGPRLISFGGETCAEKMVQAFAQSPTAALIYRQMFGEDEGEEWKQGENKSPTPESMTEYCKLIAQMGIQIWLETDAVRQKLTTTEEG